MLTKPRIMCSTKGKKTSSSQLPHVLNSISDGWKSSRNGAPAYMIEWKAHVPVLSQHVETRNLTIKAFVYRFESSVVFSLVSSILLSFLPIHISV